ncbi:unnamed protein product [Rhodiola kirilowii]
MRHRVADSIPYNSLVHTESNRGHIEGQIQSQSWDWRAEEGHKLSANRATLRH